jgi:MFS family permease
MTEPASITDEPRSLLPAFGYSQYRLLWFSAFATYIGRWIETVVGAWLVLELTNSPLLVGLLGTCRFASMLLGPLFGTLSDRLNRRLILLSVQVIYGTAALIIFLLFYLSQLEIWHLFVFTFFGGLSHAFDYSTRYAVAADIVKNNHLFSAASLLMAITGITSVLGPLLGGTLLEVIGAGGCFAVITFSFLLSFSLLLPMKIETLTPPIHGSIWQNLISGLRYIKSDRVLFSLILIAALVNLFLFPYWFTLLPIFARDILHTSATGFGRLMAAVGLGYFIGSLLTGSLPQYVNKGKLLIIAVMSWPVVLLIFSASRLFLLSITLLISTGVAQGMSMALIQSILLINSSEEMRGRVSGARAFAVGALPLGNLLTGYGASLLGAPTVLIINSSASIVITILITFWASELFKSK